MSVADYAFYAFAIVTVTAGLLVTVSRNPVHSVLWLILAFLSSAGLFVLLGAEFVAMLLIIVYVGAVAVLFLFVVMMLDIDFAALKGEMARYMPLALLIGVGAGTYSSIYIAAIALVWLKLTPEDLIPPPPSETEVLDETP